MSEWLRIEDGYEPERFLTVWIMIENKAGARFVRPGDRASEGGWRCVDETCIPRYTPLPDSLRVIAYQPMVPPPPPIEDITPHQARAYLRGKGWTLDSLCDARDYEKWIAPEDEACGWLPTDGNANDWCVRVKMIAWYASLIEQRPESAILWGMAGMPRGRDDYLI